VCELLCFDGVGDVVEFCCDLGGGCVIFVFGVLSFLCFSFEEGDKVRILVDHLLFLSAVRAGVGVNFLLLLQHG
jgi:hypothetical protein